jgi:hypothetical protein
MNLAPHEFDALLPSRGGKEGALKGEVCVSYGPISCLPCPQYMQYKTARELRRCKVLQANLFEVGNVISC